MVETLFSQALIVPPRGVVFLQQLIPPGKASLGSPREPSAALCRRNPQRMVVYDQCITRYKVDTTSRKACLPTTTNQAALPIESVPELRHIAGRMFKRSPFVS